MMNTNRREVSATVERTAGLRIPRRDFDVLRAHLCIDPEREQFAFALAEPVSTIDGVTLIVRQVFLPDDGDLAVRNAVRVAPTREFQAAVYLLAEQAGRAIVDVHTHTSEGPPRFSGVDWSEGAANTAYIARRFESPVTHAMLVFNNTCDAFDGAVYDRSTRTFRTIDVFEILGRPIDVILRCEPATSARRHDDTYARQHLVPDWNQDMLARQRMAILGLGGNGAHVLQSLVALGAGTAGWIAGIDPDVVEASNLPRIPYATASDVGRAKVGVAADFAVAKNPDVRFRPLKVSVNDDDARAVMKAATVLFGCGDNDGLRKVANEVSIRDGIPFIDLGCDIRIDGDRMDAGGQVRVVIPGETACLVCCGGFDPGQAALDLLDDAHRAVYQQRGYVIGGRGQPTPSVATLNALTAQLGVTALLGLLYPRFANWTFAHFDWLSGRTVVAQSKPISTCPACGSDARSSDAADHTLPSAAGPPPMNEFSRIESVPVVCDAASGDASANLKTLEGECSC